MALAQRYVDFVKKHDGYALLLADNQECAVPRKAWMMFEQDKTPQEQLDYGIKLFGPIAKNIVGACTGNHANRAYHDAGLEMDRTMAQTLGYEKCFFPFQGFVRLRVGKVTYKIAFKHGSNAGADIFRNCKQLLTNFPTADICATSHTHVLATTQVGHWTFEGERRKLKHVTFVSTGSLLNYPRYADEAGYQPQPKGFAILWLHPESYGVHVDVSGNV